jgi:hypothetical protein
MAVKRDKKESKAHFGNDEPIEEIFIARAHGVSM